jgi:hypothetical protein
LRVFTLEDSLLNEIKSPTLAMEFKIKAKYCGEKGTSSNLPGAL